MTSKMVINEDGWQTVKRPSPLNRHQKKRFDQKKQEQLVINKENAMMMDAFYEDQRPKPRPTMIKKTDVPASNVINSFMLNNVKATVFNGDETGAYKLNTLSNEQRMRLQSGRTARGLTRKELAGMCNISVQVLTDYENGKGSYHPQIYNRLIQKLNSLPDKK